MAARLMAPGAEAGPHAFHERFDPWTGRVWLEIRGPQPERVPIGPQYAARRRSLRQAWPDRPFEADWGDGRFPCAPWGLPPAAWTAGATVILAAAVVALGLAAGPAWALGPAAFGTWGIVRSLDAVDVTSAGIRVGPPWAMVTPWHAVTRVGVHRVGRATVVWMVGLRGAGAATVPDALLPALRARVRRCGGLALERGDGGTDRRYATWRAAAAGIPWGIGLGTLAAAPLTGAPFVAVAAGGVVALALALLAAAVEARATGWGTGGVLWLTALYALVLGLVSAVGWSS